MFVHEVPGKRLPVVVDEGGPGVQHGEERGHLSQHGGSQRNTAGTGVDCYLKLTEKTKLSFF